MKIAFFTEMGFRGKVPRTHKNMRTEFAWMVALDADHHHYMDIPSQTYDLGIVIIPKKQPTNHFSLDRLRKACNKVAVMQEGPFWYFQDYELDKQIDYFNNLVSADIVFVHNLQDQKYFKGLTNHPDVRIMPSLMIEDPIQKESLTPPENRTGIMIGGNFRSWYGGFDSFMLAREFSKDVYSPQMGRRSEGEPQLGIHQLPYMEWDVWITHLSRRKIGVHMMRTHAAGTFALNCSYLGIPCIGYEGLDTQRILHPNLTVKDGDLDEARRLLKELTTNEEFYNLNRDLTLELYSKEYSEKSFRKEFYKSFIIDK